MVLMSFYKIHFKGTGASKVMFQATKHESAQSPSLSSQRAPLQEIPVETLLKNLKKQFLRCFTSTPSKTCEKDETTKKQTWGETTNIILSGKPEGKPQKK